MIVVPDIHGRDFWIDTVLQNPNEKIIFLGDYLDLYDADENSGFAITQLKFILMMKQHYPENVVLLLGNHDVAYIYSDNMLCSRHDFKNHEEIYKLFTDNLTLFDIAHVANDKTGKTLVFSHAGIHPKWIENHPEFFPSGTSIPEAAALCNQLLKDNRESELIGFLSDISTFRGGDSEAGSLVWCDINEFANTKLPDDVYQIFGHDNIGSNPIHTKYFSCLDCAKAFKIVE